MTIRTSPQPRPSAPHVAIDTARRPAAPARLLPLLLLLPSGCAWREDYDKALAELQEARTHGAEVSRDLGAKIAALETELSALSLGMQERDRRLTEADGKRADLERQVEETLMMNAELAERLRTAGQSVEQLATERGTLTTALEEARRRLEELKRQQAAAESRTAQFQKLLESFRRMMDAGQLSVVMRDGRMLIALPNDVLFDSAKAELKPEGRKTLREVARILVTVPGRRFQIAGHTDNIKISSTRFPSNWELSTARAVEVVKLMVEQGMRPESLSAAGYGEFAPAAANDNPEGRARNRRIEIALVPDLDEMVPIREAPPAAPSKPPVPPPAPAAPAPAPAAPAPGAVR